MSVTPSTLYVCPTTHIDWDWLTDFEQYYAIGRYGNNNAVHYTFDQMFQMLADNPGAFTFNLAEMGYFRRYFTDNPAAAGKVLSAGCALALMGGGITSPDNLLSHGEAFIRNYLLGTQWLASLGLSSARAPMAWLPDDFGHDPQLPVTLAAMGMTAVALSRVPGSVQGSPDVKPLDGGATVDQQLNQTNGLAFPWVAADGSKVLGHFMPDTYSVSVDNGGIATFVNSYYSSVWGSAYMFVPVPANDFATPTQDIINQVNAYNSAPVHGVTAQIKTFADFVNAVFADTSGLQAPITLRASNYWCGHFASRPQLKTDHFAAVRDLLAAEVAVSLVTAASTLSRSVPDALNRTLEAIWWNLSATTHHDFINGTSPDQTYYLEQLPLSRQTRRQARSAHERALELLADSVAPNPAPGQTPYLVFNPLGFGRAGLVSVANPGGQFGSAALADGVGNVTTQQGADGHLLFVAPGTPSFGYTTAYLGSGTPTNNPLPSTPDGLVFSNGLIKVVFSARSTGYQISQIFDGGATNDLVSPTSNACQLAVYKDNGNLYQFGNEPVGYNGGSEGTFSLQRTITNVLSAEVVEYGPVRWRFAVQLSDTLTGFSYGVVYTLVAGESFLRVSVSGRAPDNSSAVVVLFPMVDPTGNQPDGLAHGTPTHWDDVEPVRYWQGPTFQATHDFVLPTFQGHPFAGFYHGGMTAWCRDQGAPGVTQPPVNTILGTLFRSANGTQRGAAGTDGDVHTQEFAVGVPGTAGLDPATGIPLKNGTSFATPLAVHPMETRAVGDSPTRRQTLPESLSLAGITSGPGILRAARPQAGSAGQPAPTNSISQQSLFSTVLRVYNPGNTSAALTLQAPACRSPLTASLVTALELPLQTAGFAQPVSTIAPVSGASGQFQITAGTALTSVQLAGTRVYVASSDGKS
ncbi:MAG: hypothetical protein KF796_15870 [Ramlibacter sp.]|nr:hypothetical protein [Ramlibacter sp.]